MECPLQVTVHPSAFPGQTRALYLDSFRRREMNPRFLYESEKQAQLWLALHEAYSPARTDQHTETAYSRAFSEVATAIETPIEVISLGCGGAQKDTVLLTALGPNATHYIASDISLALVLTAAKRCSFVKSSLALIDLSSTTDLAEFINTLSESNNRVFAFFGMLPNFEPEEILPKLSSVLKPGDQLLMSANLAPGPNYRVGVQKILPLYQNQLTQNWLAASLTSAGLDIDPRDIQFEIASTKHNLLRIEASYKFSKAQSITLDNQQFRFSPGDTFRLFFSYRHTPEIIRNLTAAHHLEVIAHWITPSEEEGIFLCQKLT